MTLIDTHCHLDFEQFNTDREVVLMRAQSAKVSQIIIPAVSKKNWPKVEQLSNKHSGLKAAYGLHPVFIKEHQLTHIQQLEQQLNDSNAVAIGECGLDFFIKNLSEDDQKKQLSIFISHLELAQQFNLPVIIHARKSLDIILKQLRLHKGVGGVIHSFSGSEQQAKQLIDLGFYLGFGGPITYTRARRLHQHVRDLPLDSIVLESDSPDQPDASHHGLRNEPAYISLIAEAVAKLRVCDVTKIAQQTTQNAQQLFNLNGQGLD